MFRLIVVVLEEVPPRGRVSLYDEAGQHTPVELTSSNKARSKLAGLLQILVLLFCPTLLSDVSCNSSESW